MLLTKVVRLQQQGKGRNVVPAIGSVVVQGHELRCRLLKLLPDLEQGLRSGVPGDWRVAFIIFHGHLGACLVFSELINGANVYVARPAWWLFSHLFVVFNVIMVHDSNDPALVSAPHSVGLSGQAPIATLRLVSSVLGGRVRWLACLLFLGGACRIAIIFIIHVTVNVEVIYKGIYAVRSALLPLAQCISSYRLGMAFLLLRGLPDASLVLVDAVDDLCVVISNVQHLGSFVAGHAEVFDQKYQF